MKESEEAVEGKPDSSSDVNIGNFLDDAPTTLVNKSSTRRAGNGANLRSGRARNTSAMTAIFWILLIFGFSQIFLYHPGSFQDEHWFDHSNWKLPSSDRMSRYRNRQETSSSMQRKVVANDTSRITDSDFNERSNRSITKNTSVMAQTKGSTPAVPRESPKSRALPADNPIMQILIAAGLKDIDPKDLEGLPSPEALTSLYGPLNQPIVVGMDTCASYRNKVAPSDRIAAVAGLFNTGTNAMEFHLRNNINIKNTWQVPWGKHRMEFVRLNHTAAGLDHVNREHVLPIVLIREPFYWMQSMCKSPYAAHWPSRRDHCPNLVPDETDRERFKKHLNETTHESIQVKVIFDKNQTFSWNSLAHLWSHWYRLYLQAEYPRLMFRFEDLLFHGPLIMKRIAECAGVTVPEKFHFQTGSAKGHGSHATFLDAIIKSGDLKKRLRNFTPQDLEFAAQHLDRDLMRTFRYSLPGPSSVS